MIDKNNQLHAAAHNLRRWLSAVVVSVVVGLLLSVPAQAFTDTYSRSISMSSSQPSATAVTYSVSFKADQPYSLRTVLVDFCSNSPLAGENCTAPTGFTVSGSPTIANFDINGSAASGTWTGSSQNSGRTLVVTGSAGVSLAAGDAVTFDVTTVTNPSTVGSFYGRIFTYDFASPTYSDTATDMFKETGSVALSTATGVGFIFQVPETLQFCVYKTICGDAPVVVLGHGPSTVIDSGQIDTDNASFSITTNAVSGAVVRAFGSTPKISTKRLNSVGGGTGTMTTMVAGTEAFGFRLSPTSGPIAAATCYAGSGDDYCFDDTMLPPGGSPVAITQQATPGPLSNQVMTMTFAATASATTPSGTYASDMVLIATATF